MADRRRRGRATRRGASSGRRWRTRAPGAHGAAFASLGRACHVLADMACPVHVHRVIHDADPFEGYVEVHAAALADARATPPVSLIGLCLDEASAPPA
jgi:hypothetical protein